LDIKPVIGGIATKPYDPRNYLVFNCKAFTNNCTRPQITYFSFRH